MEWITTRAAPTTDELTLRGVWQLADDSERRDARSQPRTKR